jgi:hypothetical protein
MEKRSSAIDIALIVAGAFLILQFVGAIPSSSAFNPQCRGWCWFDLFPLIPFAGVGAALILVAYYRRRRRNRKLKASADTTNQGGP